MKLFLYLVLGVLISINTYSCQNNQKNTTKVLTDDSTYVLDAHTHHGFPSLKTEDINKDMNYLKQLGYNAINFSLPVDRSNTRNLPERIENEINTIQEISTGNSLFTATSSLDTLNPDKISCFFHIEYFSGVFNSNLDNINRYKNLGISYITLIDNEYDVLFKTGNNQTSLTDFGKQIIERMNQVDLKIDISHLNKEQRLLVIDQSEKPVIISHRNCKHVAKREDNISNETLLALKINGGMVTLAFSANGVFSDKNNSSNAIEKYVDHIDHLKEYLGIDKIGIGTDMQAFGKYVPDELNTNKTFSSIANTLKNRNYTHDEINKILYKNYMDFMQ